MTQQEAPKNQMKRFKLFFLSPARPFNEERIKHIVKYLWAKFFCFPSLQIYGKDNIWRKGLWLRGERTINMSCDQQVKGSFEEKFSKMQIPVQRREAVCQSFFALTSNSIRWYGIQGLQQASRNNNSIFPLFISITTFSRKEKKMKTCQPQFWSLYQLPLNVIYTDWQNWRRKSTTCKLYRTENDHKHRILCEWLSVALVMLSRTLTNIDDVKLRLIKSMQAAKESRKRSHDLHTWLLVFRFVTIIFFSRFPSVIMQRNMIWIKYEQKKWVQNNNCFDELHMVLLSKSRKHSSKTTKVGKAIWTWNSKIKKLFVSFRGG